MSKLIRFPFQIKHVVASAMCSLSVFLATSKPISSQVDQFISQEDGLGLITTVNIVISDQVSDGCWTNASRVSAMMRLLFEQNDIVVEQEDLAFLSTSGRRVGVVVVGFKTQNGVCAASARLMVDSWMSQTVGGLDGLPEFSISGLNRAVDELSIFTSGTNLDQQLLAFYEEKTMNFISNILSARRSDSISAFRGAYPEYGKKVLTRTEWETFLSNLPDNN